MKGPTVEDDSASVALCSGSSSRTVVSRSTVVGLRWSGARGSRRLGRLALRFVGEFHGPNPKLFACLYDRTYRSLSVCIEVLTRALSRTSQPAAFELTLARHVPLVLFRTVPRVTIALDSDSCIEPFDNQVYSPTSDLDLWTDPELSPQQFERDVHLEPALVRVGLSAEAAGPPSLAFQAVEILEQGIECRILRTLEEADQSAGVGRPAQGRAT